MTDQIAGKMDILLVEDNPADVFLTKEALAESKIAHHLHDVGDGKHAMSFLRKQDKYASVPRPDLILLDLNLPVKDGREVLAELKADEDLKLIPIIVLTTSALEKDISTAYNLNANCYVVKPMDFNEFCTVIKSIENFWFKTAKLPIDKSKSIQPN
jgi:chemotaxis family two-component system response regulator Rcp1